jgi:hypothetical protein
MESGDAQPWFYGMSQEFSISRNHPYTTVFANSLTQPPKAEYSNNYFVRGPQATHPTTPQIVLAGSPYAQNA